MIHLGTICRHAKLNQRLYRFTTGLSNKLGALLGSVGHKVKGHKITPATGKDRGDIEIKYYVVLQKPQAQDNCLPPSHTLIMDSR
jgi:hypothetical protein